MEKFKYIYLSKKNSEVKNSMKSLNKVMTLFVILLVFSLTASAVSAKTTDHPKKLVYDKNKDLRRIAYLERTIEENIYNIERNNLKIIELKDQIAKLDAKIDYYKNIEDFAPSAREGMIKNLIKEKKKAGHSIIQLGNVNNLLINENEKYSLEMEKLKLKWGIKDPINYNT